ncbi:MAG: YkgJ family cysteine cluster protein [Cyclobacteriaceae bacterium]
MLRQKVHEVEGVFQHLDLEMKSFQDWSTLSCKFGCGKCCHKSDIEATVLEFLPFAQHLFDRDLASEWLEKLNDDPGNTCLILEPGKSGVGLCSEYTYRGLICRLFGFTARTNKYGNRELVTCQIIKSEQAGAYAETVQKIHDGAQVPVMNQYYMRLHAIDPELARDFYPINEAIRRAIEAVLHYYAYRY